MSTSPVILAPGMYSVPQSAPIPPPVLITKTTVLGLQLGNFTPVWGVGRSVPVNNPSVHGTCTQTPGMTGVPATYQFNPVKITDPNGKPASDNLYMMRQMIDQVSNDLLEKAVNFTNSTWMSVDTISNCQAIELDYPTPKTNGTMGLQVLQQSGITWQVRAFDFNIGQWVALSGTSFSSAIFKTGFVLGGEYTCDGVSVTHTAVTINGLRVPVKYTQPCGKPRVNLLFNAAFQMDATVSALAYKLSLNKFCASFQ